MNSSGNISTPGTISTGATPPTCTGGTAGGACYAEGTAITGAANADILYADSTAHRLKMINNNGTADTFVGAATTDTFTNKTFDTAATGNSFKINGTAITAVSGTGAVCLASGSSCGGGTTKRTIQLEVGGGPLLGAGCIPAWATQSGTTVTGTGNYCVYQISGSGSNVVLLRSFMFPSDWDFGTDPTLYVTVGDAGFNVGNIKLDVQLACQPTNYTSPTYNTAATSGSVSMTGVGTGTKLVTVSAIPDTSCIANGYASLKLTYDVTVASHSAGFDFLGAILEN